MLEYSSDEVCDFNFDLSPHTWASELLQLLDQSCREKLPLDSHIAFRQLIDELQGCISDCFSSWACLATLVTAIHVEHLNDV